MAETEIDGPNYNAAFLASASLSRLSAERIVPRLLEQLPIQSVADFGCALGAWLTVWQANGVADVIGVDGHYIREHITEVDSALLRYSNLSQPIDLGRRFDLVQSLEVAEHLPPGSAETFVESLARHGDLVLFSAAPPGQGGDQHINERPYSYWRDLFRRHDFVMLDWLRPQIAQYQDICYWYRYNSFLFARGNALAALPGAVRSCEIRASQEVVDVSPLAFRLRKRIVLGLPARIENWLSRLVSKIRADRS